MLLLQLFYQTYTVILLFMSVFPTKFPVPRADAALYCILMPEYDKYLINLCWINDKNEYEEDQSKINYCWEIRKQNKTLLKYTSHFFKRKLGYYYFF